MRYDFEWDPQKAKSNFRKHGVSFEDAATVFKDPNALSIVDHEHSINEERWMTLGIYIVFWKIACDLSHISGY